MSDDPDHEMMRIARAAAKETMRLYADMHPRPTQVTQQQAAEMLGVTPRTIHNYIRAGRLRLNRCGYLSVTDVDEMLASQ